ncbi:MAG: peptide chain release factor-like protein [Chlamydiae bacterium]|nr:peptide chain release factor-like protein [Chlamydiota bacterium]
MIRKEKKEALEKRMEILNIREEDLIEKFILGSGRGGQKIQKTSSCVYLKHIPTGVEIKCQKERSREMNRYFARKELCDRIETIEKGIQSEKQKLAEKIRRQKRRRSRRGQQRILEEKKRHSEKKTLRQIPME